MDAVTRTPSIIGDIGDIGSSSGDSIVNRLWSHPVSVSEPVSGSGPVSGLGPGVLAPFGRCALRLHPESGGGSGSVSGGGSGGSGSDDSVPAALSPETLQRELEAVKSESIARRKALAEQKAEAERLRKELEELRKTMPSPEEVEALRKAKAEHEAKMEAEKTALQRIQEAAQKKQEELNAAIAERDRQLAEMRDRRNRERINALIAAEFPKHTAFPVIDLMPTIAAGLAVDPQTDEIIVVDPVHRDQEQVDPDTGKPMLPSAYIAKFVAARPHIAALKPASGSGAPTGGIRRVAGQVISPEDITRMTDAEFKEFIKTGHISANGTHNTHNTRGAPTTQGVPMTGMTGISKT